MSKGFRLRPSSAVRTALPIVATVLLGVAACAPKGEALYARAEQALAKGDVAAAVIDLKNFVEAAPQDAKGRALLGQALIQLGDLQAGEIEIRKAKDLGAPREMTLVSECEVLVGKGEFNTVLKECQPAAASAAAKVALHIVRGRALLGLHRPDDAKAQFQAALAAEPASTESLLGLARAEYEASGLDAAKAILERAPESMRAHARYWLTVGEINIAGGDFAAAEIAYTAALERAQAGNESTERLESLGGVVQAQLRQDKVKEATATSDTLLKAAPKNSYAKLLRSQALVAGGEFEQARVLLEDVVSVQPGNLGARLLLGVVNLQQGNLGQAEMNLASVVANDPTNVRVQRLLAETRAQAQSPQQALAGLKPALEQTPDPSLLAMAGRLSLKSGDSKQALAYFTQALSGPQSEQTVDLQLEVASGYIMAGELRSAIKLLEGMPPSDALGYQREYLLITALLRSGEKERAIAEGNALVQRSGNDPAARNLVAGALAATGQRDAGRAQLNEALKLKPDDPQTLLNLARLDLVEGKTTDAEKNFKKALAVDPRNLAATLGAAVAARTGGDADGAERWLQKAVADHPDSNEARVALAEALQDKNNVNGAIDLYEKGISRAPDDPVLLNNLAALYQIKGDSKASGVAAKAFELAPNEPAVQDTYGWILLQGGKREQALPLLRDAATALPDVAEVQYHYATALATLGDREAALPILRKALAGELSAEASVAAQKLLSELSR